LRDCAALLALLCLGPTVPAQASPLQVEVALIGRAEAVGPVRDVLRELLGREDVEVVWTWPERFRPDDVLAVTSGAKKLGAAVWIDLGTPSQANLYFRDASGERFVVRRLPLERGLDELAREEIAHVVASAVLALASGSGPALSRSEARAVMVAAPAARAAPETPPPPAAAARPTHWEAGASLGIGALAASIPVGFRLEASFAAPAGPAIAAWLALGYQLPASDTDAVGVVVQAMQLRAGARYELLRSGAVAVHLLAGAGVDRVEFRPRSDDPTVELAPSGRFWAPLARLGAGVRFARWRHLALEGGLVADILLTDVHYDLHDAQGRAMRVVTPLIVQPGLVFGVTWTF
jgi:hypothetical protein